MLQIILSSILLSVIHASIPNHWLPLIMIAKAEKWKQSQTLLATAICGFAHIASTILIGILVGWAGYELSSNYQWVSAYAAPAILIGLGIIYIFLNILRHEHWHHHHVHSSSAGRTMVYIITSLSIGMFFSPCIELEAYYFTAGSYGWTGILAVSIIYLTITVSAMLLLVYLGLKGIQKLNLHFLEHYEKATLGAILIITGILAWIINI